ncbi:MAG: hypothetical protein V4649_12420 [Bacteroidota bacterium]
MSTFWYMEISKFPVVFAGLYYFRQLPKPYKIVLYLLIIAIGCEIYGYYIGAIQKQSNAWLFNFYMPVEVWALGLAAIDLVPKKKAQLLFYVLLFTNTIIWIVDMYNDVYQFANFSMVCGSVLLTVLYMGVLVNNSLFTQKNIRKQPVFWLSISTILYFGCVVPYMGMHNYLSKEYYKVAVELAYINIILNFVRYPLVAISFILLGRQKLQLDQQRKNTTNVLQRH